MNHRISISRVWAIALTLVCVPVITIGLLSISPLRRTSQASSKKTRLGTEGSPKLKAGVGSEVSFAPDNASPDLVRLSVDTVDSFIAGRSGLRMDDGTKARLTQMESDTVSGARARIGLEDYVAALTEATVDRLSTLTDEEIAYAGTTLKNNGGIRLRFNGRFGMTDEEFPTQARSLRDQSRQNHKAVAALIGDGLRQEVGKRIERLSDGLPDQFGGIEARGLTPAQALLVTYSVIVDDDLAFSRRQMRSLAQRQPRARGGLEGSTQVDVKAYGPDGRLFSTPADLIFNQATLNSLLDRLTKGGN